MCKKNMGNRESVDIFFEGEGEIEMCSCWDSKCEVQHTHTGIFFCPLFFYHLTFAFLLFLLLPEIGNLLIITIDDTITRVLLGPVEGYDDPGPSPAPLEVVAVLRGRPRRGRRRQRRRRRRRLLDHQLAELAVLDHQPGWGGGRASKFRKGKSVFFFLPSQDLLDVLEFSKLLALRFIEENVLFFVPSPPRAKRNFPRKS